VAKSQKRIRAHYGATIWDRRGGVKVVRLKMTSERRVCLGLADVKSQRVPYFWCRDIYIYKT